VGVDPPIGVSDWERISALTRFGHYRTSSQLNALEHATKVLGSRGEALDIGCGEGRWSFELRNRGWHPVCADVKETALKICQRRLPDACTVLVSPDSTELPASTGTLRLVLAFEVPAVTQAPWFASEVRRVLAPGGGLVFNFRNPSSWRGVGGKAWYRLSARRRSRTDSSYFGPSYRRFRRLLRRQGFRIVYEEGHSWIPLKSRSNSRLVDMFATIERVLGLRRLVILSPTVVTVAILDPRQ
jgi:ubiquinone/menaquinone biosynthesis C-methylase UbiE